MEVLKAFGQGLRRLRKLEGLTLEEMSKRSGISKRHLIEIEQKGVNIGLLTLMGLAEGLELDVPVMWQEIFHTRHRTRQRIARFLAILQSRAVSGLVEVNVPQYAQELGVSSSTIKRYLERLEEQGCLCLYRHRTGRGNGAIYKILKTRVIRDKKIKSSTK